MGEMTSIPVSKTTLPSGTIITKTLEHLDDEGIGNGYDKLDMRKRIEFADNSTNKLKQLGVDTVDFSKEYHCRPGSKVPYRVANFPFAKKGMITFWSGKGLMNREHLGSFHLLNVYGESNVAEIKKFFKVLADIKEQGLPLNSKTIRYLLKLV